MTKNVYGIFFKILTLSQYMTVFVFWGFFSKHNQVFTAFYWLSEELLAPFR